MLNLNSNNVSRQVEGFCISYLAALISLWMWCFIAIDGSNNDKNEFSIEYLSSHYCKKIMCGGYLSEECVLRFVFYILYTTWNDVTFSNR